MSLFQSSSLRLLICNLPPPVRWYTHSPSFNPLHWGFWSATWKISWYAVVLRFVSILFIEAFDLQLWTFMTMLATVLSFNPLHWGFWSATFFCRFLFWVWFLVSILFIEAFDLQLSLLLLLRGDRQMFQSSSLRLLICNALLPLVTIALTWVSILFIEAFDLQLAMPGLCANLSATKRFNPLHWGFWSATDWS